MIPGTSGVTRTSIINKHTNGSKLSHLNSNVFRHRATRNVSL